MDLYNLMLKQISRDIYQGVLAFQTLKKVMQDKKEIFSTITVLEQVEMLCNVVGYLRRGGSVGIDLSLLEESKGACKLRVGYNITDVDFAIIHQSPCGLVERIQKI